MFSRPLPSDEEIRENELMSLSCYSKAILQIGETTFASPQKLGRIMVTLPFRKALTVWHDNAHVRK